jgi:hypothetical protein
MASLSVRQPYCKIDAINSLHRCSVLIW